MVPRLSVVLTNYNHAHYLRDAISSLVDQERPADEIVIVDDASTDESLSVIEEFLAGSPSIRLIRNEENLGVNRALARGIEASTGDFLAFASADDRVMANYFRLGMSMLEQHPDAGACSGSAGVIDESGAARPVGRCFPPSGFYAPPELVRFVGRGYYIGGLTTIVKRTALEEVGGFRPDLRWYSDWFALQLIVFRQGMCVVPDIVAARRVLGDSYSGRASWGERERTALHVCTLLEDPEYADVRPVFRSGALAALRWPLFVALLVRPRQWSWLTRDYLRLVLVDVVRAATPVSVRRWYSSRRVASRTDAAVP